MHKHTRTLVCAGAHRQIRAHCHAHTLTRTHKHPRATRVHARRGFVHDGPTISCLTFIETQLLQPSSDPDGAGSMELPVDPELITECVCFVCSAFGVLNEKLGPSCL